MLDFLMISTRSTKRGVTEIYPKFIVGKHSDLMIRGGDFYAIWIEELGLWSTDEQDVIRLIDTELDKYAEANRDRFNDSIKVLHMWDSESGMIDIWHKYCQRQLRDYYKPLDENLIFANQKTTKKDLASKKLPYSLEEGPIDNFDELISSLYNEEERYKIEWAIGSIVSGASKKIEKFLVLYGTPGTGKGTILKVIERLFVGYTAVFDARSIGSATNEFALEAFKSSPLVAIQYDGDLSKIENNARLNSLVSHEKMTVNEKHKSLYAANFYAFLFMGTNKPVKVTDSKSGIIRRLIDVSPRGVKIPKSRYNALMSGIEFELGHIAYYCKQLYENDPDAFDDYIPTLMLGESNDFYNFMLDSYIVFKKDNGTSLKSAWEMYKNYCDEAKVPYPLAMRAFRSELRTYFENYDERTKVDDVWVRSYYSGFKTSIFEGLDLDDSDEKPKKPKEKSSDKTWLDFKEQPSNLDIFCAECPAQYASSKETPREKWSNCKTVLSDLDTKQLHYLKVPENLIVIDFDLRDENGNKSFEKNLEAASKWPRTYAELSKSGGGIHLHYIYNGDVNQISRIYADNIEIKVFTGNSSLRRKVSKCTNDTISSIDSGLPLKGDSKVINFETIKNEKALRTIIKKNLNKEYHGATKPSIDFIYKVLEDAYNSGMKYDVSDMYNAVFAFAANSTNQSDYCLNLMPKMHFCSDDTSQSVDEVNGDKPIVFFDVEVYPNLFVLCYKMLTDKNIKYSTIKLINPTKKEIEDFITRYRIVGFNNRRYDNHILYARLIGYTNEELFKLSQRIIKSDKKAYFGEAYNISYTDIYDYCNAENKMSLKKWEIKLGIHHQEMPLSWDKPVPKELWNDVADYCENDVISTEAVWFATQSDFTAREILADLAGMSVNDTTNSLTIRIIFGMNKHPQLNYVNLEDEFPGYEFKKVWDPVKQKYDKFNMYRDIDLGFGGYVYAEPGMYGNVALLDVKSMHPHSAIAMNLFGEYTKKFANLVETRVDIKEGRLEDAKARWDGLIDKYLTDESSSKKLAKALKTAINSVYGLTSANFENPCRDPRNENNIVALRGALFMKTLQDEVAKRGFIVAHIKTDSIKIPDATPEIIQFCMDFAKKYGYEFDHEATYDRMCLVNNAVYIARYKNKDGSLGDWTATGTQFAVPYVYKTCFSKEPIEFRDLCETKEVTNSTMYLNMNEDGMPESEYKLWQKLKDIRIKETAYENNYGEALTKSEYKIYDQYRDMSDEELDNKIHSYYKLKFVGRVGLFTPIAPGKGGGELLRETVDKNGQAKYDAVVGTKGYRWLESEDVEKLNKQNDVDMRYYIKLVDDTVKTIDEYGDYEWFTSEEPYAGVEIVDGRPNYNVSYCQIDNPFRNAEREYPRED